MNLRHLHTFLVVAEELHFGRAAVRLHVAQPAVSQTIAALEADLGLQLFDRSRRAVVLTPAGSAYVDEVRAVFEQVERAEEAAHAAAQGSLGRLDVAFTAVCALGFLPDVVVDFMRLHPDVDVRLHQLGSAEQIQAVHSSTIDVGFSILPDAHDAVHSRLIAPDEMHLFLRSDSPLALRERIEVADAFAGSVLLMSRDREPCVHRAFERLCDAHGIPGEVVAEVDHLESMLAFVRAGLGVSLAPSVAAGLSLDGVTSRPLEPSVPSGISAVWDPSACSPTAQRFLDHLCATMDAADTE